MRIIRFAILIILPLLSLSCLSNKKLISEEKYLQQAEMVLDSFSSYFQDPLVQLKFNRSLRPKQLIESKYTGNFEHGKMSVYDEYSKIYLLKPYVVLNDTEQSFLNIIQESVDGYNGPKELYYTLLNFLYLPHKLGHEVTLPGTRDCDGFIACEKIIDQNIIYFLYDSQLIQHIENFEDLVRTLHIKSKERLGKHLKPSEAIDKDDVKHDLISSIYFRSEILLQAIDNIKLEAEQ